MHQATGNLVERRWKGLLPATLLALAVGCGGAEAPRDEAGTLPEEASESQVDTEGSVVPGPPMAPEGPPPVESPPAPAPTPVAAPWFHRLGDPQDDVGTGLAVDGTGHVSVVWLSTPRQDQDREPVEGEKLAVSLVRYSPEGEELWRREFPRNRVDAPRVAAAPSGEVFLSGNAFLYDIDVGLGAARNGFLVKFSASGEPLWQRRAGQKVWGTVADGSGGVFVSAEEWTPGGHVPVLAHYDAQGAFVWTRQLPAVAQGTELRAVALSLEGRLLLAGRLAGTLEVDGQRFGREGGAGLVLLAFGTDGSLAWGREWREREGRVTGLVREAGGEVLVGVSETGAFVLAAGPQGAERWAQPLTCDALEGEPQVVVDELGQVVALCGATLSTYSAQGAQRDERVLSPGDCTEGGCPVLGTALGVVAGRGLAVTGWQRHGGGEWDQEAFVRLLTQ